MAQTGVEGAHLESNFLSEKYHPFGDSVVKSVPSPAHSYSHTFTGPAMVLMAHFLASCLLAHYGGVGVPEI